MAESDLYVASSEFTVSLTLKKEQFIVELVLEYSFELFIDFI